MVVPQATTRRRRGAARSDFQRGFEYLYEVSPESIGLLVLGRPGSVLAREPTGLPEKPGRLDSLLRVRLAGERRARRLILDFKDRWRGQRSAAQMLGYATALYERHGEWPLVAVLALEGPRPDGDWGPWVGASNPGLELAVRCRLVALSHLEASGFIEHAPAPALILAGATRGITPALMRRALGIILQRVKNPAVRRNLVYYAGVFCTRIDPRRVRLEMEEGMKSPFGELMRKRYKQGHDKGLEQGHRQGQVQILLCLLRDRFGRVPATTAKWLAGLSEAQLKRLARKVLTARSLAELRPARRRNGAAR